MNLNITNWKNYRLGDLFEIKKGKRLTSEEQTDGETPYIGAIDSNNGVANYIGQPPIHAGNTISLSYNGSVGQAFYQPVAFWATDDVNVLYFRDKNTTFNRDIALFICTILKMEQYRYCYGRKWVVNSMNETIIKLPTKENRPDWDFMAQYIKALYSKPITSTIKSSNTPNIDTVKWKRFIIKNLFDVILSKGDIQADDMAPGAVPLVSSGETNNGIVAYIDRGGDGKAEIFDGNMLTVDMFCNAFYQKEEFYAVSHGRINILIPKFNMDQYIGLFISAIINKEKYKYSYGRAVYSNVIANMEIKLPIQKSDNHPIIDETCKFSDEGYIPDWEWMGNYIKSLPYSDRI